MNWNIVEGNWKQFRGKAKAQWGKITNDHLNVIVGKRVELAAKLQEVYTASRGMKLSGTDQELCARRSDARSVVCVDG